MPDNKRKTGARTPRTSASDENTGISQEAAANKPPKGIGNSDPVDDVDAKTRHSDGIGFQQLTG